MLLYFKTLGERDDNPPPARKMLSNHTLDKKYISKIDKELPN